MGSRVPKNGEPTRVPRNGERIRVLGSEFSGTGTRIAPGSRVSGFLRTENPLEFGAPDRLKTGFLYTRTHPGSEFSGTGNPLALPFPGTHLRSPFPGTEPETDTPMNKVTIKQTPLDFFS
jgi:hypothetical protein